MKLFMTKSQMSFSFVFKTSILLISPEDGNSLKYKLDGYLALLLLLGTHLLGCGTGRTGLGTPGVGAGPQTAEGPWTTLWPCTAEGLRTRRELLGSAGSGF